MPTLFSQMKTPENVLAVGRRVRLTQDRRTLRKGMEGTVHSIICWAGEEGASVTFSFRNGDTTFNMEPKLVPSIMELLP